MFIHESPTKRERRVQTLYDGRKYKLLSKLLWVYNFNHNNAYFTHAIKCSTPKGREPSVIELRHCTSHLLQELSEVKPKIIVTFGNTLLRHITSNNALGIFREHGKARIIGKVVVVPTFSTSFLNQNPKWIPLAVKDWEKIFQYYNAIHPAHYKNLE